MYKLESPIESKCILGWQLVQNQIGIFVYSLKEGIRYDEKMTMYSQRH